MGAAILNNYENTWLNLHTNEIITDRFSKNVIYFYFYLFFFLRLAWDSNPGPSDYEATWLTTRPARDVMQEIDFNPT